MTVLSVQGSGATYTSHAASAAAMACAAVVILAWIVSLWHVVMPTDVTAACSLILTLPMSVLLKKFGLLSD